MQYDINQRLYNENIALDSTKFFAAILGVFALISMSFSFFSVVTVSANEPEPQVTICHIPPGNSENAQTLEIDEHALAAHQANHGIGDTDTEGACPEPVIEPPVCGFDEQEGRIIVEFQEGNKKLFANDDEAHAMIETTVTIPAGVYDITLVSYDGYSTRVTSPAQLNESWFAILKDGGTEVARTSAISDLLDNVLFTTLTEQVETSFVVASSADSVVAYHAAYPDNKVNSLDPVCAVFDEVQVPKEPTTITASKVVCENESDLPNWGAGGANITATTATDWVDQNESCSLVDGWSFQWGDQNVSDPGSDFYGEASGGWSTFGPTDVDGTISVEIEDVSEMSRIWVREVLQEGYLPFTHPSGSDASAELYCDQDVLNYDNYDYINNPELDTTYYCVGFNTEAKGGPPEEPPYAPYCGDDEVNQEWEQCDGGSQCTAQCQDEEQTQCRDIAFARVNVAGVQNTGDSADMTSNIFLGSDSNMIPQGAWFLIWQDGSYVTDSDMTSAGYEDVAGLAVQRLAGSVRTLIFGSHGGGNKEHVDGTIEFFNTALSGLSSDDSGNNRLENGFNGTTSYSAGNDEVWDDAGVANFWLTVTTADDGFYAEYEEPILCPLPENTKPVITLTGDVSIMITVGDSYSDDGATADDTEDGDITNDIVLGGDTVDPNTVGTYTVTYNVADVEGLDADEVTRTVEVKEQSQPPVCTSNCGGGGGGGGGPLPDSFSIFNEKLVYTAPDTAVFTWETDKPATSRVVYDDDSQKTLGFPITYGYELSTEQDSALVVLHSMTITGLLSEAQYFFRPVSTLSGFSKAGNEKTRTINIVEVIGQCDYLKEYLRIGDDNNPEEVTKLQVFLRDFEGFTNLAVTGIFDQATFDAVSDFQERYGDDVLTTWGINAPTGYVYYTTQKKINEIYCQKTFALSTAQLAEIEAFKALLQQAIQVGQQGTIDFESIGQAPTEEDNVVSLATTVGSEEDEDTEDDESTIGETAQASVPQSVGGTIRSIIDAFLGFFRR